MEVDVVPQLIAVAAVVVDELMGYASGVMVSPGWQGKRVASPWWWKGGVEGKPSASPVGQRRARRDQPPPDRVTSSGWLSRWHPPQRLQDVAGVKPGIRGCWQRRMRGLGVAANPQMYPPGASRRLQRWRVEVEVASGSPCTGNMARSMREWRG